MLHLVVIGIVWAVSAPREGIALIGLNNYSSSSFWNIEGNQNQRGSLFPLFYNVKINESLHCSKQTNRSSSFFYYYVIKQYKNSKYNFCSYKETPGEGKKKNSHLNVEFTFRKRKLLWTGTDPKKNKISVSKSSTNLKKNTTTTKNLKSSELGKGKIMKLRKVKHKREKRNSGSSYLDNIKVKDKLNINKRLQKLAGKVALRNLRSEKSFKFDSVSDINNPVRKVENLEKINGNSSPLYNNFKKMFRMKNNFYDNKKNNGNDGDSSVSVNIVRTRDLINNEKNHISSYDILKNLQKKTRFRRNLYKNFNKNYPYDEEFRRFRKNLSRPPPPSNIDNSDSYNNFLHFRNGGKNLFKRKLRIGNRKIRPKYYEWPFVNPFLENHEKQNFYDLRLKRNDGTISSSTIGYISETSNLLNKEKSLEKLNEKLSTTDSIVKSTLDGREVQSTEISVLKEKQKVNVKRTEENSTLISLTETDDASSTFDYTLERPPKKSKYTSITDLESRTESLRKFTGFPKQYFQITKNYENELSKDQNLSLGRYLKIRHALRHYLIHNNVWNPFKRKFFFERKKRCGNKCSSLPHKCWRSAPLLCIPYIRRGQDELLKYLIKTLQKMLGKPFPQKIDIFEKTKFKPSSKKSPDNSCDDIMPNEEECECENTLPPCQTEACPTEAKEPEPCNAGCSSSVTPKSYPATQRPCPSSCSPALKPCPATICPTTATACPSFPTTTAACPTTTTAAAVTCPTTYINPCPTSPKPYPTSTFMALKFCTNLCPTTPKPCTPMYPFSFPCVDNLVSTTTSLHLNREEKLSLVTSFSQMTSFTPTPLYHTSSLPTQSPPHTTPTSNPNFMRTSLTLGSSSSQTSSFYNHNSLHASTPFSQSYSHISPPLNPCSWLMSKSPYEEPECFSYTPAPIFSPTVSPTTMSYRLSQIASQIAEKPELSKNPENFNSLTGKQNMVLCPTCPQNLENTVPEWTFSTIGPDPISDFFDYRAAQEAEKLKFSQDAEENLNHQFPYNYQNYNKMKPKEESINKDVECNDNCNDIHIKEGYARSFHSDEPMKYEEEEKKRENYPSRAFKTIRHNKMSKFSYKPVMEFLPSYDYDFYERYPFMRFPQRNKYRYSKYNFPWLFDKDFGTKVKKHIRNFPVLKRKKRNNDYYSSPEEYNVYDYYSDNSNYNEQYSDDFGHSNSKDDKNFWPNEPEQFKKRDSESTPSSYALFSELAQAVTQSSNESADDIGTNLECSNNNEEACNDDVINEQVPNGAVAVTQAPTTAYSNITTSETGNSKSTSDHYNCTQTSSDSPLSLEKKSNYCNKKKKIVKDKGTLPTFFLFSDMSSTTPLNNFTSDGNESTFTVSPTTTTTKPTNSKLANNNTKLAHIHSAGTHLGDLGKLEKESENNQDMDTNDEGQMPTTLKFASIVKGPKKLFTKPSPKIYTKVYPDSLSNEVATNENTTGATTSKPTAEKTTIMQAPAVPDIRLQLLAVCEGYLEVVKLIKAQNQTLGEELDADLSQYCENIISQSFNLPSDNVLKSKKPDSSQPSTSVTTLSPIADVTQMPLKNPSNFFSRVKYLSGYTPSKELTDKELRDKVVVDILSSPVYKRELAAKIQEAKFKKKKIKKTVGSQSNLREKYQKKIDKQKRIRRKEDSELLKKGMSEEQIELLHLLRKRKRALLNWLFTSKEEQIKPDDLQETEYFDDEECASPNSDLSKASGTVTLKGDEETTENPKNDTPFYNESIIPVYAKQYGYDKGGELREVEVLWRKVNEKTHEKKIFKNVTVLALLLTSTSATDLKQKESRSVGNSVFDNEEMSETQPKNDNRVGFAEPSGSVDKTTNSTVSTAATTPAVNTTAKTEKTEKNETYTFMNKPDPSLIVGTPPNSTTISPNTTRKVSHKFGAAKDFFQEYTIEFLNYAVYILPIMFTLLFLFCCMCCFWQILKMKTNKKRKKKRKKKHISTEDDTETTEESEPEVKKKRRSNKRKKEIKNDPDEEHLDKKRSKSLWNVLKLNSAKPSSEFNEENSQTEKKRSFLRFLKGKRDEGKPEDVHALPYRPLHELEESGKGFDGKKVKESNDSDDQYRDVEKKKKEEEKSKSDEANERRELIALLEELKKIETENHGEKKEQKSVYVQYMTQEEENSVFKSPEFSGFFPQSKSFRMPGGYSLCRKQFPFCESSADADHELHENVEELAELIPCDCGYYSRKNDFIRRADFRVNEGRKCERFFKIFQDSGVTQKIPLRKKDFMKNESGDRSYIFNKYRSISTDTRDKLMGGSQKNASTEISLSEMSPFGLSSKKETDLVEEMENLKRQLNKKKYVRLKDDGVLCRL